MPENPVTLDTARRTYQLFRVANEDGHFIEIGMRRNEMKVEVNFGQIGNPAKQQVVLDAVEFVNFIKAVDMMLVTQIITTRNRVAEQGNSEAEKKALEMFNEQLKAMKRANNEHGGDEPWRQSLGPDR